MMITGRMIRDVRERLGLDPFAYAAILGVHVSAIYRWEQTGCGRAGCDPQSSRVLAALIHRFGAVSKRRVGLFGDRLRRALESGQGGLHGLWLVLGFALGETT